MKNKDDQDVCVEVMYVRQKMTMSEIEVHKTTPFD